MKTRAKRFVSALLAHLQEEHAAFTAAKENHTV